MLTLCCHPLAPHGLIYFRKKCKIHKVITYSGVVYNELIFCFQESPRKRVGMSDEGPGRLPEVKAIQQTRRLLANARERTRVHTISAAFEALRKQVRPPVHTDRTKLTAVKQEAIELQTLVTRLNRTDWVRKMQVALLKVKVHIQHREGSGSAVFF